MASTASNWDLNVDFRFAGVGAAAPGATAVAFAAGAWRAACAACAAA
jgi:hypothetical protein